MYERILVPLDGSEAAERALPHALEIARRFESRLILARVVSPLVVPPVPSFAGPELSVREHPGDAEAAEEYLARLAREISEGGLPVETVVRHGSSADEILACIADDDIALVVMTAQGWGGIVRLFGGHTVEAVLARAMVPVLVIPPDASDEESEVSE